MKDEYELTFLLGSLPEGFSKKLPFKEIHDIYLPNNSKSSSLRIRRASQVFELIKKETVSGNDKSHSKIYITPLSYEEYTLLNTLAGASIHKIRYEYIENGTTYEIDFFRGNLDGLVLVDVEFDSAEKKAAFTPPLWLHSNVTQETFLTGSMLCGKSYKDIESDLQKFNYQKVISSEGIEKLYHPTL